MTRFTLDDLRQIMRECAGEDPAQLHADIDTSNFTDLGYDSLAVLEISAVIQHRYVVRVPDGSLEAAGTLGDVVDLVNRLLGSGQNPPATAAAAVTAAEHDRGEAR